MTGTASPRTWNLSLPGGRRLELGDRPQVMGILNITPDSFSDGGLWLAPEKAVERALQMLEEGAVILDLGAESTRPGGGVYGDGARTLTPDEELERLMPVLEALRRATDAILSVDTRKGPVAKAALDAGADLINDVGGLSDDGLVKAVAEAGCPVVVMHSRGDLSTMQRQIAFDDVVAEVCGELRRAGERGRSLGLAEEQLIYDPGIGFGKTRAQNLQLIARLDALAALGRPLLLGASRKSFIAPPGGPPIPPDARLGGSLATVGWAAKQGTSIVRVHDVRETVQFLDIWRSIDLAL